MVIFVLMVADDLVFLAVAIVTTLLRALMLYFRIDIRTGHVYFLFPFNFSLCTDYKIKRFEFF